MAASAEFNLGLLPERKLDWRAFVGSYSIIGIAILLLLFFSLLFPQHLQVARKYVVTELIARPDVEPKPIQVEQPKLRAKLLPPAPIFAAPKLVVPPEIHTPKPPAPEIQPPKVEAANFMPPVLKEVSGARPAPIVHTGDFGSSATPTLNVPVQKVQTGGFGDPNGLKGEGKPAHLVAASTGAFDLPQGAGSGNGSGGAKGLKGTVASAGFGNGIAQAGQSDGRNSGRGVQTSGFGSTEIAQNRPKAIDASAATTPVDITYKPSPAYTEEARQLQLQGEVLLEVSFGADGSLHVNRVVRGLGHGLDETAIAAANKIKFKPALRSGLAVDSVSIVHVVFQLAM
jgi:TonB family protein